MGVTAALKARQIIDNVEHILAIELLAAAQGIDLRRRALGAAPRLGAGTAPAYDLIRQHAPFVEQDTVLYPYIDAVHGLVTGGRLTAAVAAAIGERPALGEA
jgi:histidine ammonia-lyase